MKNPNSDLILKKVIFDEINFIRRGFKNDSVLACDFQVKIGRHDEDYKVSIELRGKKESEYDILVIISGFFGFAKDANYNDKEINTLISKNAVAILLPYLRSEVSLLTAQPDTECIVLPIFNVNKIYDNSK